MQKKIFLVAVYFTLTGVCATAQDKKQVPAPPSPPQPPTEHVATPPPPPPPVAPPPPPVPPAPPVPPPAPSKELKAIMVTSPANPVSPVIINSNGYEMSIHIIKDKPVIYAVKENLVQQIKLSTWQAKRKFYEKKYGHLPRLEI